MAKRRLADPTTVQGRMLIAVREAGGPLLVAQRLGISKQSMHCSLSKHDTFFSRVAAIAVATGVSLDWIATGGGAGPVRTPRMLLAALSEPAQ